MKGQTLSDNNETFLNIKNDCIIFETYHLTKLVMDFWTLDKLSSHIEVFANSFQITWYFTVYPETFPAPDTYLALSNWITFSSVIIEHMAVLNIDFKKFMYVVCMPSYAHILLWHITGVLTSRTFCWKEKKTTVFIHSVIHSLLVGPSHRVGFMSLGQELWWWSKVKFLLWLKTCLPTSLNIPKLLWHCALPA